MSKNTQISELINYISVNESGNVVFTTVPAATTNTDKFLVSDSGVLKFRTAAQLLSDIGAQASGSYQAALSGTGFVKISGSTISYDNSTYLTTSSASSTYLPLSGGTLTGGLIGTSASFSSNLFVNALNFSATYNVATGDGLTISSNGATLGSGNYGAGLVFTQVAGGSRRAAIVPIQGTADNDTVGLAFFTHPSAVGATDLVEQFRISYNGAATFSNILNIGYDSNNRSTIRLTSNAANRQAAIYFYGNNTESAVLGYEGGSEVVGGGVQGDFVIRNVLANRHIILATNNGNVGIGTLIPTGKLMIEATGNHLFLRASSATAGKYWNFDVTSANQLYIVNNAGSQYLTILDGGDTGLGVVTPSYKFDVSGRIRAFTAFSGVSPRTDLGGTIIAEGSTRAGLYILTSGTAAGSYGSIWWGNGNTNTDAFISVENNTRAMRFGTADGTRMSILSGGNVGVNTTDPLEKFSVTGNAHIAGVGNSIYFDTDGSGRAIRQYVANLYDFHITNGRGVSSRFILGSNVISLGTTSTPQFSMTLSTGASTFSGSISAGGNISGLDITGSMFLTATSSVSNVGTSFVNSGTSFGNTTGIWLVSITAFGDGNMYSAALYVVTTAAYSKTLNLIGGPSNHFGNGSVVAELSTTDGVSADLRVRRTTVGSATVYVKVIRTGS